MGSDHLGKSKRRGGICEKAVKRRAWPVPERRWCFLLPMGAIGKSEGGDACYPRRGKISGSEGGGNVSPFTAAGRTMKDDLSLAEKR